jgi:hypothetical protein
LANIVFFLFRCVNGGLVIEIVNEVDDVSQSNSAQPELDYHLVW